MTGISYISPGLPAFAPALAFALVLAVGLILLIRGLLGRRVGDEPRCRKCDYNLTGLEAENCPECGTPASGKNVVIGRRRRRRASLIVGALLLLLSGGGLGVIGYGRAKSVNWYAYYPRFVLLSKARADDRQAIDELVQRVKDGLLTYSEVGDLVPMALARHGAAQRLPSSRSWADLLAVVDRKGGLTGQQQERFYQQFVRVWLKVRPRIRQGDELPVEVWREDRGTPFFPGEYIVQEREFRVGGQPRRLFPQPADGPWTGISTGSTGTRVRVDHLQPGPHPVEYVLTKSVYGLGTTPGERNLLWSKQVTLSEIVEVLPPDAPDPFRLIDEPALAQVLKDAIKFGPVSLERAGLFRGEYLEAWISINEPLPIDVGFDVFALAGEREIELGRVTHSKGRTGSHSWQMGANVWAFDAEQITPVLRTSRKAASESIECFEIWNGELRLDPVKVEPAPQASQMTEDE